MVDLSFGARRAEYAALWKTLEIRPSKAADIEATARKVLDAKNGRYNAVQVATNVPWYVVGIIHQLECGGNFSQHLHCGDPLTVRTVHVPRGRPKTGNPPFTWKESAIDAVQYDGLDKVANWSLERILYELEKYNGWGYAKFHPEVASPYLWSGTNHYSRGKYVADGVWSASAVSGQSGAVAILKRLTELDPDVRPQLETEAAAPAIIEDGKSGADAFPKAEPLAPGIAFIQGAYKSRTVSALTAFLGVVTGGFKKTFDSATDLFGLAPQAIDQVSDNLTMAEKVSGWMHVSWPDIETTLAIIFIVAAFAFLLHDKAEKARKEA